MLHHAEVHILFCLLHTFEMHLSGFEFALEIYEFFLAVAADTEFAAAETAFPVEDVKGIRFEVEAGDFVFVVGVAISVRVWKQFMAGPFPHSFGGIRRNQKLEFARQFTVFAHDGW